MNKTAIVEFIIDELVLKLWNVSIKMRKRVYWILKGMEVTLKKYDSNARSLSKWVKVGGEYSIVKSISEIKKGVSNYKIENQTQADALVSLNNELRCYTVEFKPEKPILVHQIDYLLLHKGNCEKFKDFRFGRVKFLELANLNSSEINQIVAQIDSITKIKARSVTISNLDLKSKKTINASFYSVEFQGKVLLPPKITKIVIINCKNINFLITEEVSEIENSLNLEVLKEYLKWLQRTKRVKYFETTKPIEAFIEYLPTTVRKLVSYSPFAVKQQYYDYISQNFPYLISYNKKISLKNAQKMKLRSFRPELDKTEEVSTFRPRRIEIDYNNYERLNKYPELFEKVKQVKIADRRFNLDCLSDKVKKLELKTVDTDSKLLSRF